MKEERRLTNKMLLFDAMVLAENKKYGFLILIVRCIGLLFAISIPICYIFQHW
jgi:hypothetical protein